MKMQILVPHYNEPLGTVTPLIDSIALQQNVDFSEVGVIICHDGEDIPSLELDFDPAFYPFDVKEIWIPHKGVSAARNAALDAATANYVMFCDADDMFFSGIGLWQVFREMEKDFDVLISAFLEETRTADTGEPIYIPRERNAVCVHGKVFRREFLAGNNIRWDEDLTIHEDSYFNILAQSCGDVVKYMPNAFYLWRWRDGSVCRRPENHTLETYDQLIESNDRLVRELERRGLKDKAAYHVAGMIYDAYYRMHQPDWGTREAAEARFARYIKGWDKLWRGVPAEAHEYISLDVGQRICRNKAMASMRTVKQWVREIKSDKKKE